MAGTANLKSSFRTSSVSKILGSVVAMRAKIAKSERNVKRLPEETFTSGLAASKDTKFSQVKHELGFVTTHLVITLLVIDLLVIKLLVNLRFRKM